jgi:hypothetical protein
MTIEEVAQENGFTGNSDQTLLFISLGRILSPEFTLHAHQIKDGQTIFVHLSKKSHLHPLDPAPMLDFPQFSSSRRFRTLEDIAEEELAKFIDRDFANLEVARSFPSILQELLGLMQKEKDKYQHKEPQEKTVIVTNTVISESPLPRLVNADPARLNFCQ